MNTLINKCSIIQLPKISNRAGNISVIESEGLIPFKVKRVFYIYDIPGGINRGGHAHKKCHQFLVAASGAFTVEINDNMETKSFYLNQPYYGLYISPGIWAQEIGFSSGSICLVLASDIYDEADYIRDYSEFIKYKST